MATNRNSISSHRRDRGERIVRAVLPTTANIKSSRADKDIDLIVNGQALEVKWIGSGHLGSVRSALKERPKRHVVLVAQHMSPGARAALSEAGVSWADETGAAEISVGSILVSKSGLSQRKPSKIEHWTPAVIAVAEALLLGIKGTQAAMQDATGLSAGSCTNALRFLTSEDLLSSGAKRGPNSARVVSDPRRLLDAYAAAASVQTTGEKLQIGVTWRDVLEGLAELGRGFTREKLDWAVTGGAGAAVMAPYISSVSQASVYVEAQSLAELEKLASSLTLRPVEGGRLTLKSFPNRTVQHLAEYVRDLRVAPWPRLYVDLLTEGVRGEEAAEHLYEAIHERRNT